MPPPDHGKVVACRVSIIELGGLTIGQAEGDTHVGEADRRHSLAERVRNQPQGRLRESKGGNVAQASLGHQLIHGQPQESNARFVDLIRAEIARVAQYRLLGPLGISSREARHVGAGAREGIGKRRVIKRVVRAPVAQPLGVVVRTNRKFIVSEVLLG